MHIIDPYALIRLTVHDVPAKQARAGAKQGWFRGEVSNHELSRRHFVRIDFPTNEHAIKDLYDELETKLIQIGYKTGDAKQSIEVAESIGLQRTL